MHACKCMRVYAGASRRVKTRWGNHSTRWAFYPPHIMRGGKRQGKREEEREKGGGRVEANPSAHAHAPIKAHAHIRSAALQEPMRANPPSSPPRCFSRRALVSHVPSPHTQTDTDTQTQTHRHDHDKTQKRRPYKRTHTHTRGHTRTHTRTQTDPEETIHGRVLLQGRHGRRLVTFGLVLLQRCYQLRCVCVCVGISIQTPTPIHTPTPIPIPTPRHTRTQKKLRDGRAR
jgi:hypothetical protein